MRRRHSIRLPQIMQLHQSIEQGCIGPRYLRRWLRCSVLKRSMLLLVHRLLKLCKHCRGRSATKKAEALSNSLRWLLMLHVVVITLCSGRTAAATTALCFWLWFHGGFFGHFAAQLGGGNASHHHQTVYMPDHKVAIRKDNLRTAFLRVT